MSAKYTCHVTDNADPTLNALINAEQLMAKRIHILNCHRLRLEQAYFEKYFEKPEDTSQEYSSHRVTQFCD